MEKKINCKSFWVVTRKVLNISWKVALVVIGLFAALIIACAIREQINDHYGKDAHYWDRNLSENICVHVFSNMNVRVYDRKAEKYVTPNLEWVASIPDKDSLTVFCDKDGKRGFLNVNTGKITIEGKYEHAWIFSEGLAAVVEPNGKMGFIDGSGEYVIAPEIDYIDSHDYVFKHNVCCIENSEGNQGLLSRDGKWVLPQEYSYIDYIAAADMFVPEKDGKEGLLMNGSFEWVYPVEYDNISWTDAPSGHGFILYKDFRSWHVSLDGTVIDEFLVDDTRVLKYMVKYNSDVEDEYAISDKVVSFKVHGLWGVMDKQTGKVLIPAKYGNVEMVSKNIIKCSLESGQSEDSVLYDLTGKKIE